MLKLIRRFSTVLAVSMALVLGVSTVAYADDSSDFVSGYTGGGIVYLRTSHAASNCVTHKALFVINDWDDVAVPQVLHQYSRPGRGWVCVSDRGYRSNKRGDWWDGRFTGVRG